MSLNTKNENEAGSLTLIELGTAEISRIAVVPAQDMEEDIERLLKRAMRSGYISNPKTARVKGQRGTILVFDTASIAAARKLRNLLGDLAVVHAVK